MERAMHPTHFQPGEGKSHRLGRMTMTFKTTTAEGWNAYTLCEAIEPPDSGAGYHRHATYDETFVICEGHYDFRLDGKLLKLGPGDPSCSGFCAHSKAVRPACLTSAAR